MRSPSSTSSSELSPLERLPRGRFPVAAVVLCLSVAVVEVMLALNTVWFADLASWQWKAKNELLTRGVLRGDVVVLGSSVLYHSIDPVAINAHLPPGVSVVNLALNGMQLQHESQVLERYLTRYSAPRLVVLELRSAHVERESWLRGPYYGFWASWSEFLASRMYFAKPSALVAFAASRVFISYRYRVSLDNWFSKSIIEGHVDAIVRQRNERAQAFMGAHQGFLPAEFEMRAVSPGTSGTIESGEWNETCAGGLWLHRIIRACARRGIGLVLCLPPAPPDVQTERRRLGFNEGLRAYVGTMRGTNPDQRIELLEFTGFGFADFSDQVHLSAAGRVKLTEALGAWLAEHCTPTAGTAGTPKAASPN
jgi:hypothetical protein